MLVPACNRELGTHPFHVVGSKYIDAVRLSGALPLVVPMAHPDEIDAMLDLADGVLLTGSPSNVHPRHFDEPVLDPTLPLDSARDAWTLPLIPRVLARGMPLFAICRGAQEVNVALGGSLWQAVHEAGPYRDHRESENDPLEVQYGPSHDVEVVPGGLLEQLLDERRFAVNSLHGQAVNRLAPPLRVEARAPDGLIEAFSAAQAKGFCLCVQWHPEWRAASNRVSTRLLQAFGGACRAWHERARPLRSAHPGARKRVG